MRMSMRSGITAHSGSAALNKTAVCRVRSRCIARGRASGLVVSALIAALDTLVALSAVAQENDNTARAGEIETILVTGRRETLTLRSGIPLEDLSRSVQVYDAPLIEEIRPWGVEDIVGLAANATFGGPGDGRGHQFSVRGFSAPIMRDGFTNANFGGVMNPETWGMERVEVLKGPDSIQYGESDPGGLINFVSKRARFEPEHRVQLQGASFGVVESRVDLTGSVGGNAKVAYRVVALAEYGEHWRAYDQKTERVYAAPSLLFRISDRMSLNTTLEYTRDDIAADFGTAVTPQGQLFVSTRRVNNHPGDTMEREQLVGGYDFEYAFNPDWTLTQRTRYFDTRYVYSPLWLPNSIDPKTKIYRRFAARQKSDNEELAWQLQLQGSFASGTLRHTVLVGADYRDSESLSGTGYDPTRASFIDFTNPDYSELPLSAAELPFTSAFSFASESDRRGIFLQSHSYLGNRWVLNLGIRHEDSKTRNLTSTRSADELIPQVGLIWKPLNDIDVFVNYSESFTPNTNFDINGNLLPPENGEGFELGMRWRLLKGGLALNAAVFQITKRNVATADPEDPAFPLGASTAQGEQRSEGVEFDLRGRPLAGWNLVAALGFASTKVLRDEAGLAGNELTNTPDITLDVFSTYEIQGGFLRGLGFGGGLSYVGKRWGDLANTAPIDAYTVLNAQFFYRHDPWSIGLVVRNLLNEDYVETAFGGTARGVHPGRPAHAVVTCGYRF